MKGREIKFKVWEIGENRFVDYYDMSPDVIHVAIADQYYLVNNEEKQEFILCQYSGLKDKNGEEIYEGDIVSSKSHNPENYLVEFIEGGFCMTSPKVKHYPTDINHFYPSVGTDIEVIGNIYQDENLLSPPTENK